MKFIKKIKLKNFKRFENFEVDFDKKLNLFIGDNEAGKSTILNAIDFVVSGSKSKVEKETLENLFNKNIIISFLDSEKNYFDLPELFIELYLNEQNDHQLNGKANSSGILCDGLKMICKPMDEYSDEIKTILEQPESNFPFEYYSTNFTTFSGEHYTGYNKFLRHIFIDNTMISNKYATKQYVKSIYESKCESAIRYKHFNEYRKFKNKFENNILDEINDSIDNYDFTIKDNSRSNLETDLTISEDGIELENKGKGRQCFIKTEFALNKTNINFDLVLLEEPENHLSHINMKKLINNISESVGKQMFIATHSNLISTRLDLRKSILLNSNSEIPVLLKNLDNSTAEFFIKAPDNNILELILSKKVILVEGDSEYILMNLFFEKIADQKLADSNVHIISVGGTSFKRYLDISKLLNIKTAVIRDNDGDYQSNCVNNYENYIDDNIKIFFDNNNERYTFEFNIYKDNEEICNDLFSEGRRTLSVDEYMINNKTDTALKILKENPNNFTVSSYIKEAILWIKN